MVAVEEAVAVVMQESGRRALFDATQRLGANDREKAGLINSVPGPNMSMTVGSMAKFALLLLPSIIDLLIYKASSREK